MKQAALGSFVLAAAVLLGGCASKQPAPSDASGAGRSHGAPRGEASAAPGELRPFRAVRADKVPAGDAAVRAILGQPAPSFELVGLDGKSVRSSDLRGKIVVLEWFNPDCPFVRQAHGSDQQLRGLAKRLGGADLVWLAVNSGGPGKQGHGREANEQGRARSGIDYPILLDESGTVGRAFGAERTPHLFVIDREGRLVYRGALDNTEGGDVEDASPYVSYVADAVADVRAGRAVRVAETKPYGCSVKYAK